MQLWLTNTFRLLVTVTLPVVLVLTNVRLVLLPWYPSFEYNKPNFPPDAYGFTQAEREHYASLTLDFLLNDAGIAFLAEQTFSDGAPLYNERELRHMEDVKAATRTVLAVWKVALVVLLVSGVALGWQAQTYPWLRSGLSMGAAIVVVCLLALVAYIIINFTSFFTRFHQVLFESGTWMFLLSDTLIRLFPIKFWADVFMLVGGVSLMEGVLIWWASWWLVR